MHRHHSGQETGRQVYNRLGKVVLEIDGAQTPLTAAAARALAADLTAAADRADQTPYDGAAWTPAEE